MYLAMCKQFLTEDRNSSSCSKLPQYALEAADSSLQLLGMSPAAAPAACP